MLKPYYSERISYLESKIILKIMKVPSFQRALKELFLEIKFLYFYFHCILFFIHILYTCICFVWLVCCIRKGVAVRADGGWGCNFCFEVNSM